MRGRASERAVVKVSTYLRKLLYDATTQKAWEH